MTNLRRFLQTLRRTILPRRLLQERWGDRYRSWSRVSARHEEAIPDHEVKDHATNSRQSTPWPRQGVPGSIITERGPRRPSWMNPALSPPERGNMDGLIWKTLWIVVTAEEHIRDANLNGVAMKYQQGHIFRGPCQLMRKCT